MDGSMWDQSAAVSDVARSQPASDRPQHGLAPSPTRTPSPSLPEIPAADLDLDLTRSFDSIMGNTQEPHTERVQKRASNVLKLTEENEKLKEQLRAMTARLEAAERRRREIATRQLQQPSQLPGAVPDAHLPAPLSQGSS